MRRAGSRQDILLKVDTFMSLLYDQVNEYLQLSGHTNIFAVGDCCDTPEHKMAAFAGAHGETVARNIVKELMGCSQTPYKRVDL